MRVFVTGGSGFVGAAIVRELLDAGHEVLALARSDAAAARLEAMGARVHRGSLEDLESLERGVGDADGVIHTAFDVDAAKFAAGAEIERRALETIGRILEGSERPLLVTSGFAFLAPGRVATEADVRAGGALRSAEDLAASFALRGVRASVVRLPMVHGVGDRNVVPPLVAIARAKGISAYVGDGATRWPAVHQRDAAHLYRLALEKSFSGERFHAIAEEGIAFRDIAEILGRRLGLPVASIPLEMASDHFGVYTLLAAVDTPATSTRTRELLGWQPREVGLLADLEQPGYIVP